MTDTDNAKRALDYLQGIRQLAQRVDHFDEIASRERNERRAGIIEANRNNAQRKLDQARELCKQVGGVEGEILEYKYVCGYDDKTTAFLVSYSESRMRELAAAGRAKYGKLLSVWEFDKTP